MPQLLVRDIPASLVQKLKHRAVEHGVSAEEEHRRILREALSAKPKRERSLMDFLTSTEVLPDVELDIERSKDTGMRDINF